MDIERLTRWRDDMRVAVDAAVRECEVRYPFPLGENVVAEPEAAACATLAALRPAVPHELLTLYAVVGDVSLPDINNGFFLYGAACMVEGGFLPEILRVSGRHDDEVAVFASDGGGTRYGLAVGGAPVYRLPPGLQLGDAYESDESLFEPVSSDLPGFLDRVLGAVRVFAVDGTTTYL